jgi:hypothetical protein
MPSYCESDSIVRASPRPAICDGTQGHLISVDTDVRASDLAVSASVGQRTPARVDPTSSNPSQPVQ